MSEAYENLTGASGRARYYRPRRFSASALFSGAPPEAWFEGEEFTLDNISASGAAIVARESADVPDGPRNGVLRLTQEGREIFRGAVRQAWRDESNRGSALGVALEGCRFDLTELARRNSLALAAATAAPREAVALTPAYKSYCADVLCFVGDYLLHIEKHFGGREAAMSREERREIALELSDQAASAWRDLLEEGNRHVVDLHRNNIARKALKDYTERVVTRELVRGESWARSYYKPMGYPGDFRIMNFMYDAEPAGETLAGQFLHMLGVIAGRPIVTRMETLAEIIAGHAKDAPPAATVNILSVGCGPARELETLLRRSGEKTRWRATLVDQEPEALDYALERAASLDGAERLQATALNISFKEMLYPSPLSAELAEQDVLYSAGLVDYLNPLMAMRYVRRMYDYLKPGGKLIIGNVNDLPTGTLWPMEYVLDWTLYFRSREEMIAMAAELPDDASVRIEEDSLNAIFFLVVDKPR